MAAWRFRIPGCIGQSWSIRDTTAYVCGQFRVNGAPAGAFSSGQGLATNGELELS